MYFKFKYLCGQPFNPVFQDKRLAAKRLAVEIGRLKSPFASAKRAWLFKGKGGHCLSQGHLASLAAALKNRV
jgi:hypothetical protein